MHSGKFAMQAGALPGELRKIATESMFFHNANGEYFINSACFDASAAHRSQQSPAQPPALCTGQKNFAQEVLRETVFGMNRAKNERITRIDSRSERAEEWLCRRRPPLSGSFCEDASGELRDRACA